MNQTPFLNSSISTYNPQNFISSGLNNPIANLQNSSSNSSINTISPAAGIGINPNAIYSGSFEHIPSKSTSQYNFGPMLFVLIILILVLSLTYKFYQDSKKIAKS